MLQKSNLPQLIILYGPPGSGKGTQANMLKDKLKYEFLDFGQSFRDFVKYNLNQNNFNSARAARVNDDLISGKPILTEDFFYILQDKILYNIKNNINFVIDKPGSLTEEAKWFVNIINDNKIKTKFFHLILDHDKALERITGRWYLPNNNLPFPSYQEALKHAQSDQLPYQRSDDESVPISTTRIKNMYGHHNDILDIYSQGGLIINDIIANRTVQEVSSDILSYLEQ